MSRKEEIDRQKYFPRLLHQPEGSLRFGADALLLACLLRPAPGALAVDIGCGCGAVGLALALRCPGVHIVGVDMHAALCRAAKDNARSLGLQSRYDVVRADVACTPLAEGCFDIALANPPFYRPGSGRMPAARLRRDALFEQANGLAHFCRAAALVLKPGGRLGIIFPATREADLLASLCDAGFAPASVLPVAPRRGQPPIRLLVEALRFPGGSASCAMERFAPLVLHEGKAEQGHFSEEALAFCPFLAKERYFD